MIFKKPWLLFCFLTSLFLILMAVVLTFTGKPGVSITHKELIVIFLAQIGGAIFFSLLVGYFYDKLRYEEGVETIWTVFRDLSEGGIIRFYMDREEHDRPQNALVDLRKEFDKVRSGEVKLVGVSLRVFFNQTGPFYTSIYKICELSKNVDNIRIRALVSHPDSPEVINRANIETPDQIENPLIKIDIRSTIASINNLNKTFEKQPVQYGYYNQAPYCTCIIFPDKCYFSPNILAKDPPVRLPMIVFQKDSNGYQKLNKCFEHLWETKVEEKNITEITTIKG